MAVFVDRVDYGEGFLFCGRVILRGFVEELKSVGNGLVNLHRGVLGQHCSDGSVGCVHVDVKMEYPVDANQNEGRVVSMFDKLESGLAFRGPMEWFAFSCELCDQFHDAGVVLHEASIELGQIVECLDCSNVSRGRHVDQGLDLLEVGEFALLPKDVT